MCCLFGLIDYRGTLTAKQKTRLIRELSIAAEVRGTDATGIAYNTEHGLQIYKRPLPAHRMRLNIPSNAKVIMGHTRMATQGRAKKNENNHPFRGSIEGRQFALAHNGVLYNDYQLRRLLRLPASKIETDSYIAVQLLEQKNTLDPSSLKYMAEQVEGSFTFTVLTDRDGVYFVKGDNPLCLVLFPDTGVYVYASTEEILNTALLGFERLLGRSQRIQTDCGEIIKIDRKGRLSRSYLWNTCSQWRRTDYDKGWQQGRNDRKVRRRSRISVCSKNNRCSQWETIYGNTECPSFGIK